MTWRTSLSARFTQVSVRRLGLYAGAGLSIAFLAMACTVTTDGSGNPGGGTPTGGASSGGDGSGGTTSSGGSGGTTSSGGSGGSTGGSGGSPVATLDCHENGVVSGVPAEPGDDSDDCWSCIADLCGEEYGNCHAQEPYSVCGYDSADGALGGEIDCIFNCFDALVAEAPNLFLGDDTDIDTCAESCGASSCGSGKATQLTWDLASCATGFKDESLGCQQECGWYMP